MKRFLINLFKHPGTWVLGSVVLVGVAIAVPVAAPGLLIAAAIGTGASGISLLFYIERFFKEGFPGKGPHYWITQHPIQAAVVGLALALFITALVLTIGFFTGGFAFMAPVFAAGAAAAVGGVSLPAVLATAFVIAPLTLGNNLKRFLGWLDSFKYDAVAATDNALPNKINGNLKDKAQSDDEGSYEQVDNFEKSRNWKDDRGIRANNLIKGSPLKYFGAVFSGMKETIVNGCSSLDADKLALQKLHID